ncbi:TonB-dependent receptor [Sphingomonas yunnanensis]|nr:TonB-dependent receptor [Sphingomonas yunnanensis]
MGSRDVLATLPGVWADRSAGTAANTIRVRGIPLDGYQAIAVQEDGLPVQHDTLPWTDVDQFVRPDLSYDRVDYVRGGPAAIFASNAPGGVLNLRTRAAAARATAALRATADDRGRARLDAYAGRAIGGWRVLASGMAVRDPSVRRIAATLGGCQARIRADHLIGSHGQWMLGVRRLDDDTLNISSSPMIATVGGRLAALPGFDPRRDSWFGPDLRSVRLAALGARPMARNDHNRLAAATTILTLPLAAATLTLRARHRRSVTARYALSSSGPPVTARAAAAAALPRLARASANVSDAAVCRTNGGGDVAPATLVETLNPVAADTRLRETIAEGVYDAPLALAGRHDLTIGLYATRYHWDFRQAVTRALVEARGRGGPLDLVALDRAGRVRGALTDEGFVSRGTTFEQIAADQRMGALYLADEWAVASGWRIDWGIRRERASIAGRSERPLTADAGDAATLADDALVLPSGRRERHRLGRGGVPATLALRWRAAARVDLFARATRAIRLPDPGVFRLAGDAETRTLRADQGELGMVARARGVALDATVFASRFRQIALEDLSLDPTTGGLRVGHHDAAARTLGVELAGQLELARDVTLRTTVTAQDPRLVDYPPATAVSGRSRLPDLSGRRPRRVPQVMAQASAAAALPATPVRLDADVMLMGRRYADDANQLDAPRRRHRRSRRGPDAARRGDAAAARHQPVRRDRGDAGRRGRRRDPGRGVVDRGRARATGQDRRGRAQLALLSEVRQRASSARADSRSARKAGAPCSAATIAAAARKPPSTALVECEPQIQRLSP